MSANIVLPLTTWAKTHLQAILTATTEAAFDSAFNQFVSHNAHITVNGKHVARSLYKEQLMGESAVNKLSATVKFDGAVEVPTDPKEPIKVQY